MPSVWTPMLMRLGFGARFPPSLERHPHDVVQVFKGLRRPPLAGHDAPHIEQVLDGLPPAARRSTTRRSTHAGACRRRHRLFTACRPIPRMSIERRCAASCQQELREGLGLPVDSSCSALRPGRLLARPDGMAQLPPDASSSASAGARRSFSDAGARTVSRGLREGARPLLVQALDLLRVPLLILETSRRRAHSCDGSDRCGAQRHRAPSRDGPPARQVHHRACGASSHVTGAAAEKMIATRVERCTPGRERDSSHNGARVWGTG